MTGDVVLGVLATALALGATYALIGVAWVIVFRGTHIFNFATGETLVLALFAFYTLETSFDLPFLANLGLAVAGAAVLNTVIYRFILVRTAGHSFLSPIIITLGLAVVMSGLVLMIWGWQPRSLPAPIPNQVFRPGGEAIFTTFSVIQIGLTTVFFLALLAWLRWSRSGAQMRALAENPLLASQSGIDLNRVGAASWVIAAIALAFSGIGFGYTNIVSPEAEHIAIRGIAPAVLGGLDSVQGVAVGALIVALIEVSVVTQLGSVYADPAVFGTLLLVLILKPSGLFGTPTIRRI